MQIFAQIHKFLLHFLSLSLSPPKELCSWYKSSEKKVNLLLEIYASLNHDKNANVLLLVLLWKKNGAIGLTLNVAESRDSTNPWQALVSACPLPTKTKPSRNPGLDWDT